MELFLSPIVLGSFGLCVECADWAGLRAVHSCADCSQSSAESCRWELLLTPYQPSCFFSLPCGGLRRLFGAAFRAGAGYCCSVMPLLCWSVLPACVRCWGLGMLAQCVVYTVERARSLSQRGRCVGVWHGLLPFRQLGSSVYWCVVPCGTAQSSCSVIFAGPDVPSALRKYSNASHAPIAVGRALDDPREC